MRTDERGMDQICVCVSACQASERVCVCVHVFVHVYTSAHLHHCRLCGSARLCRLRCTSVTTSVSSVPLAAVRRCRSHRSDL